MVGKDWRNPKEDLEIRVAGAKRIATIFKKGSLNRDEKREYRVLIALEQLCYRSAQTREEYTDARSFEILLHRVASEKAKRRREVSQQPKQSASFHEMLQYYFSDGSKQPMFGSPVPVKAEQPQHHMHMQQHLDHHMHHQLSHPTQEPQTDSTDVSLHAPHIEPILSPLGQSSSFALVTEERSPGQKPGPRRGPEWFHQQQQHAYSIPSPISGYPVEHMASYHERGWPVSPYGNHAVFEPQTVDGQLKRKPFSDDASAQNSDAWNMKKVRRTFSEQTRAA